MSNATSPDRAPFSVSIIVPTLNEAKTLPKLLRSIAALIVTKRIAVNETIVVDANSSDETRELAKNASCLVIDAKPGNVSASRNLGAMHASGNILAFIDADCELPTDWLIQVEGKLSDDDVLATGACMELNPSSTSWVEKSWYELAHKKKGDSPCDEVNWLATFNLAVRKDAFDKISGFDEQLATCEDVDFGYRLSELGRLKKIHDSGVLHHGESKTLSEFFRREAWRARGSWAVLKKNSDDLREVVSFLLPIAATSLAIFALAMALTLGLTDKHTKLFSLGLAISSFGFIGLTLLLSVKKKVQKRLLPKCAALLAIYFFARCYGTFRPFPRVER